MGATARAPRTARSSWRAVLARRLLPLGRALPWAETQQAARPPRASQRARAKALALSLTCLLWLAGALPAGAAPRHLYLTWPADPAHAVTVNLHVAAARAGAACEVRYDTLPHEGDPTGYAFVARGRAAPVAGGARAIGRVELTGLHPGRAYWLAATDGDGFSPERAFRTAPAGDEPVRFLAGGDMGVADKAVRLQEVAAAQEPLFALVGGDLAYAGRQDWATWDLWFDHWERTMVTPAGFTIPIVAAIGNHEVAGGYGGSRADAPIFLACFAAPEGRTYFTRRVGSRVVLHVLDSGHLEPHGGAQRAWLEGELARDAGVPVRLAAYHVPLFPGFRLDSGRYAKAGRREWQPLFDRYRLMVAFEHHDHELKRTHPIRGRWIDPEGTVYLGDGAFGRGPRHVDGPRQVHLRRRWYLDRLESQGHVWRVDVGADSAVFAAVGADGRVLDRIARPIERVGAD